MLLGGLLAAGAVLAVAALLGGTASPQLSAPIATAVPDDMAAAAHRDGGFAVWAVDGEGAPLRWDACAPVRFVLNPQGAPTGAEADVRRALAMLATASGLDLRLEGSTAERPALQRPLVEAFGGGWRWRPVLVAWSDPDATDVPLTAADRGVALPIAVRDGDREAFVTGQVVMNGARSDLVAGFGDRADAIGATLVHELGHILGLAHVEDPAQLMSEDPGAGPVVLGAGDLAGLRTIGASAGCTPAPTASSGRGLTVSR